jgi:hypothetical protein
MKKNDDIKLSKSEMAVVEQIKHLRNIPGKRYDFWFLYRNHKAVSWEGCWSATFIPITKHFRNTYSLKDGKLTKNTFGDFTDINFEKRGEYYIKYSKDGSKTKLYGLTAANLGNFEMMLKVRGYSILEQGSLKPNWRAIKILAILNTKSFEDFYKHDLEDYITGEKNNEQTCLEIIEKLFKEIM